MTLEISVPDGELVVNDFNPKEMIMTKLTQYMKARAKFENVEWLLTEDNLMPYYDKGVRNFFGVEIDDEGNLLEDQQQPSFFNSYKSASIN